MVHLNCQKWTYSNLEVAYSYSYFISEMKEAGKNLASLVWYRPFSNTNIYWSTIINLRKLTAILIMFIRSLNPSKCSIRAIPIHWGFVKISSLHYWPRFIFDIFEENLGKNLLFFHSTYCPSNALIETRSFGDFGIITTTLLSVPSLSDYFSVEFKKSSW